MQPPRGIVERTVRKGLEPRASTRLVFTGPFEYTRANRVAIRGLASVLDIRLREVLREALGATYGVSVSASPTRVPRQEYSVSIAFGSAPERADELVQAIMTQIDSIRTRGPDSADVAKVVEAEVRARETGLRQNNYWLSQLMFLEQTGEPAAPVVHPRGDADLLSAGAIQRAAARWLDPANHIRVTLVPERTP
jgi:zinc protease